MSSRNLTANSSKTDLSKSSSASEPVIALAHVSRTFGSFAALRDVTAEFHARKMYVVLGENGAGKTTLLRAIAGLMRPTRGTIKVLGTPDLQTAKARIGYMAHASLLYDEMSALENLRYFAALYSIHDDLRCTQVIETVGLNPSLLRRVGQYSQGMRQRLSLARALVHDPEILLLDEPFSNVDVVSMREMVRVLAQMRDNGKTVLIVTHQAALLDGVADEFIYMAAGKIAGRSRELATIAKCADFYGESF